MKDKMLFQLIRMFDRVAYRATPAALLILRVLVGVTFMESGIGKWRHLDATTEFFSSIGLPLAGVNAAFIATLEVLGGFALALGFGTRVFSFLLAGTMGVALLTADRAALGEVLGGAKSPVEVSALVLLVLLLMLFAVGGGTWGLDHRLRGRGNDQLELEATVVPSSAHS